MQQITLELGSDEDNRPTPTLEPEREQRIIALMAQIIDTYADGRVRRAAAVMDGTLPAVAEDPQ